MVEGEGRGGGVSGTEIMVRGEGGGVVEETDTEGAQTETLGGTEMLGVAETLGKVGAETNTGGNRNTGNNRQWGKQRQGTRHWGQQTLGVTEALVETGGGLGKGREVVVVAAEGEMRVAVWGKDNTETQGVGGMVGKGGGGG